MSLIAYPEPTTVERAQPLWGVDTEPYAQGVEGQRVQEQIEEVWLHWNAGSGAAVAADGSLLTAELSHGPVGPRGTFYVRAQYVHRGRGKPMPYTYSLDDL